MCAALDKDLLSPFAQAFAEQAAAAWPWAGPTRLKDVSIRKNLYSDLLRLQLTDGKCDRNVWVKMPRVRSKNAEIHTRRLEAEFEILETLAARFQQFPDLDVVRPLAIHHHPLALLTEEAVGPTLHQILVRQGRIPKIFWNAERLERLSGQCGKWLRIFHETTCQDSGDTKWNETVAYCETRLEMLVDIPESGIDAGLAEKIRTKLLMCMNIIRQEECFIAGRHDDFAPHNIVVTDNNKITVLDFSMFDYDCNAFDCYNFIHRLESLRHDTMFPSRMVDRLIAAFVHAYGAGFPRAEPLKAIVYCRLSLAKLLTHLSADPKGPLKRRELDRLRHVYRSWLQHFAVGDRV